MASFCLKNHHNFKTIMPNTKVFGRIVTTILAEDLCQFLWKSDQHIECYRQNIPYQKTLFSLKAVFKKIVSLILTKQSKTLC